MNAMQADIDQNEADSDAAELSLTVRLGVEEQARAAADASLETRLAAEEGARSAADSSIDTVMAAMQADIDANEADADADLGSIQNKWKGHVFAPEPATVPSGHNVMFAAQGHNPMKQVAYIAVNGMIMSPVVGGAGDFIYLMNANGVDIDGVEFQVEIMEGDRISYFGEEAIVLQS
jgi:hypothetical protein